MKGKPTRNKNKILVALVALFTMMMCVSIGFATWITAGGSSSDINGTIETDEVTGGGSGDVDVITINSLSDYQYKESYGFVDDGIFGNTLILSGECTFNTVNGKSSISSYRNNKKFSLNIELITALNGGFSGNNITSSEMSISSDNFVTSTIIPTNNSSIVGTLSVTCTSTDSDFDFSFNITLNWSGTLASFPNISSADFSVILLAKEYSA